MIDNFTGVSDPYEEPTDAELTIDTSAHVAAAVRRRRAAAAHHRWVAAQRRARP